MTAPLGQKVIKKEFLRLWQWLPGQFFRLHGRIIHKRSQDRSRLFQVSHQQVIIIIHIGMVCTRFVIEWILNELKTGDANRIKRQVVGRTCVVKGDRRGAQVGKRLEPLFEDRSHLFIALGKDASYFTGPVVKIIIGGDLLLLGLQLHIGRVPEMVPYIMKGAQQSLFFSVPESYPDRTFWLDAQGL